MIVRHNFFRVVVSLIFALSASLAHASYMFSYENLGGDVLSGIFDGMLQADNDSVIVTSISDLALNGSPLFPIGYIESFIEQEGGPVSDPIMSLSGDFMDIIACHTAACSQGFLMVNIPSIGASAVASSFGFFDDQFEPSRYSVSQVPEPTTLALLSLGLVGLGFTRRKVKA